MGKIARPLIRLLKKNSFSWDDPAKQVFISLNTTMCSTHALIVHDFKKPFVLECDVSGTGLGAILTHEGKPLYFTSKQLCHRNLWKSTYDKVMMAILHDVETWWPYLLRHHFKIKIDHHNLKYFLEQHPSSPEQHKWVTKMFGYDYDIIYKNAKENVGAYALSHQYEDGGSRLSLSTPIPDWLDEARQEWL